MSGKKGNDGHEMDDDEPNVVSPTATVAEVFVASNVRNIAPSPNLVVDQDRGKRRSLYHIFCLSFLIIIIESDKCH